jgi:hypothetical protein
MKANDDEAANKFSSATLDNCSVMPKSDEVLVEQVGRLFRTMHVSANLAVTSTVDG